MDAIRALREIADDLEDERKYQKQVCAECAELARLRGLIGELESPSQTDFYPCRCDDLGEECLICRLAEAAKGEKR